MDPLLMLLRLAGSLVVIVALAVVVLRWVVPRLPGFRPAAGSRLEVLEVRPLDRQSKVVLLRVDEREILAAFGAAGVARLDSWPAPEAVPARTTAAGPADSAAVQLRRPSPLLAWIDRGSSSGGGVPGDGAA